MITFTIPGLAMGKQRVRLQKATGRLYTPERTLNYEARIAAAGGEAMAGAPLLDGPIRVTVEIYAPIPQSRPKKWKAAALAGAIRPTGKPDIDNVVKAIFDGLNLVVWVDDAQIVDAHVRKWYSDTPRVVITVQPEPTEDIFE